MSRPTTKSGLYYAKLRICDYIFKITFISSSFELLCESARDTLDMKRLMKLYNVCQATTNNVILWVKWSRTSSAISNSNVRKHTNCSFMKKYISVLVFYVVPMCNPSQVNDKQTCNLNDL